MDRSVRCPNKVMSPEANITPKENISPNVVHRIRALVWDITLGMNSTPKKYPIRVQVRV